MSLIKKRNMVLSRVKEDLQKLGVKPEDRILVALSGGADSMALLYLLNGLDYFCQAAHCNFHLRDQESDQDEQFVFDYCLGKDIPIHVKHFDTREEAIKRGVSVEMAARDLRYQWFWELVEKEHFQWLMTGHHGDDMIETFFLNLARGTGLRGLKGMKPRNGKLVRPFLFLRREDIEKFCNENGVPFRTDSSNSDVVFQRNNIRHNVLPVMNMLNPSFFNTMLHNFRNLDEAWQIFEKEVSEVRKNIVAEEESQMLIPVRLIVEHPQKRTMLFEILHPYGFNSKTIDEVVDSLEGTPGKQFFSHTHRLVRDRYNLILVRRNEADHRFFYIQGDEDDIDDPFPMSLRVFEKNDDFTFSRNPECVHLDADLIEFPLHLRHWEDGDHFRPLGMEQFKKLSDFFVDQKFSLVEKEKTWLLISGEDIIWVVGHRIDDRFKVTKTTRRILELKKKT